MMIKSTLARLAGFIYIIVVLTGIFNLIYVPSQLIDWKDTATTVNNIIQSDFLFRLSIVAGIISYICFAMLSFVLYQLFESVNKIAALLMLILVLISVPISILNMINKVDVLTLLSGVHYLNSFENEQLYSQVMLLLKSYSNGTAVAQIFWGLWLFPFGFLVYKSNYFPRIFGLLLMFGCFGYLVGFLSALLFTTLARIFHQNGKKVDFIHEKHGVI